jgi:hypothetical protein
MQTAKRCCKWGEEEGFYTQINEASVSFRPSTTSKIQNNIGYGRVKGFENYHVPPTSMEI